MAAAGFGRVVKTACGGRRREFIRRPSRFARDGRPHRTGGGRTWPVCRGHSRRSSGSGASRSRNPRWPTLARRARDYKHRGRTKPNDHPEKKQPPVHPLPRWRQLPKLPVQVERSTLDVRLLSLQPVYRVSQSIDAPGDVLNAHRFASSASSRRPIASSSALMPATSSASGKPDFTGSHPAAKNSRISLRHLSSASCSVSPSLEGQTATTFPSEYPVEIQCSVLVCPPTR